MDYCCPWVAAAPYHKASEVPCAWRQRESRPWVSAGMQIVSLQREYDDRSSVHKL